MLLRDEIFFATIAIFHTCVSNEYFFITWCHIAGGKFVTSPKSKVQPKLKSFHEEKSPKMRMINGQSTESLESLSDELASNSGGNNSTNEVTNRRGRVRSNKIRHCLQNPSIALLHFHLSSFDCSLSHDVLLLQRPEYHRYRRCRAMYDCEADNDDELSFEEGDVIMILAEETEDENWMEGILESDPERRGLFPSSFVHILSDWPSPLSRDAE